MVSVFTLANFSSPTRMGFVFYDIFLRCILLYLFASNVLLSILTLEWLNYLQATVFHGLHLLRHFFTRGLLRLSILSSQPPLPSFSGHRIPYSSSSMTFYYSRTSSSVYIIQPAAATIFFSTNLYLLRLLLCLAHAKNDSYKGSNSPLVSW